MHRQYFPACRVDGPIEPPAPYAHLIFRGAVPNKCSRCSHLFEGGCKRHLEILGHYLHLDYGPCGVDGPTDPVTYEDAFVRANVEVPRKCANCRFLAIAPIHGLVCRKDAELWSDYHHSID
ncbi:MAG: hypothetical protein E6Q88_05970 [Lysobacteraceae bacterium]|nr:MAG: hypothetical protein E6Q88_05970 [Xanthomonadaceae bacterium]